MRPALELLLANLQRAVAGEEQQHADQKHIEMWNVLMSALAYNLKANHQLIMLRMLEGGREEPTSEDMELLGQFFMKALKEYTGITEVRDDLFKGFNTEEGVYLGCCYNGDHEFVDKEPPLTLLLHYIGHAAMAYDETLSREEERAALARIESEIGMSLMNVDDLDPALASQLRRTLEIAEAAGQTMSLDEVKDDARKRRHAMKPHSRRSYHRRSYRKH